MTTQNTNFKNFTNKFSLTKTLRFELIPVLTDEELNEIKNEKGYTSVDEATRQDKTEYFVAKHRYGQKVIEKDKKRDKAFRTYKKLVTYLNSKFIDKALTDYSANISDSDKGKLSDLIKYLVEFSKLPKKQDDESDEITNNRKTIIKTINKIKHEISPSILKHISSNFSEPILYSVKEEFTKEHLAGDSKKTHSKLLTIFKNKTEEELKEIFKDAIQSDPFLSKEAEFVVEVDGERKNIFEFFDKWATYLSSFYELRKFIYENNDYDKNNEEKIYKGESVRIITRILDDNSEIFAKNWLRIQSNFKCEDGDESKEKFDCSKILEVLGTDYNPFSPENFYKTLSQSQIDKYNKYVATINQFLNEHGKKDFLDKLYKQILGIPQREENKQIEIDIDSMEHLKEYVFEENPLWDNKPFIEYAYQKATENENVLSEYNQNNIDLSEIILNTNKLSYYSNFFFGYWNIFKNAIVKYDEAVCPHKNVSDRNSCPNKEKHELLDKFNQYNEIDLSAFVKALSDFKADWNDDEREISFAEFLQESVEYGNFNLPKEVFEKLSNKEDIAAILFTVFSEYYKTLIQGRSWELLSEKETGIAESDKKSLRELKEDLLQKYSVIKIYVDSNQEIPKKQRDEFFKALNYYFTRINEINRFLSIFAYKEDIEYKSAYQNAIKAFDATANKINRVFNEVRNYATKRLIVEDKIKLTFDVQELLGGWDVNEIKKKRALLFIDKNVNKYYVGIVINDEIIDMISNASNEDQSTLLKMNYKFVKDTHLSIPKSSTQLKEVKKHFQNTDEDYFVTKTSKVGKFVKPLRITKEIFEMNNYAYSKEYLKTLNGNEPDESKRVKAGTKNSVKVFQKEFFKLSGNKKYYRQSLNKWINFCKDFLASYPSTANSMFDWSTLKNAEEYDSLDEFYSDVNSNAYSISFTTINWDTLKNAISSQDILLFEIYNKDFSRNRSSNSCKNLHTLYFAELFSDANLKLPIFKLSGGAEIFFREALPISEWEEVPEGELKNPKTNKKPFRKRRFTQPKILFHVPIEINRINEGKSKRINELVQTYIQEQKENIKIIGIDRGEKHLAYYCVVDTQGNIVRDGVVTDFENGKWVKKQTGEALCDSLNEIGVKIVKEKDGTERYEKVNYQKLLDKREKEREKARKEWTTIEGIKDLKKGYISQVVHKIAHMAVDNNAVIAMEDLNFGFKRGRIRIEKSIYQQLENALLEKLQFFVREKTQEGVRNALQLMGELQPQYKWGKQQGIVFYVDAKFTSRTCPYCGWRRRGIDYMSKVSSLKKAALDENKIKLFYEKDKDRFRIEYKWEYKDTGTDRCIKTKDLLKTEWEIIYSDVERSYWSKKDHSTIAVNPTQRIKESLDNSLLETTDNILTRENENKINWKELMYALNNITNLRFDDPNKDENDIRRDVIQCPKCHFDTRKANILINADAVGAYNIARRAIIAVNKINQGMSEIKVKLSEWDEFTFEKWDKNEWQPDGRL